VSIVSEFAPFHYRNFGNFIASSKRRAFAFRKGGDLQDIPIGAGRDDTDEEEVRGIFNYHP
jgi:hypothetical protein